MLAIILEKPLFHIIITFGLTPFSTYMKGSTKEALKTLTKIESIMNCKMIEEWQTDQYKKYLISHNLQDGSKENSVTSMVCDLAAEATCFEWVHQ